MIPITNEGNEIKLYRVVFADALVDEGTIRDRKKGASSDGEDI